MVRSTHRQLRIGFDLRRMWKTGIGRYARNILTAVSDAAPEHQYVAVVNAPEDAIWVGERVPHATCVIRPAAQYSFSEMFRMPQLREPVDIWHVPHPYHVAHRQAHRTIVTALDLIQLDFPDGWKGRIARQPFARVISKACARADRVLAISQSTREQFQLRLGVQPDRIAVTHLAADPHFRTTPTVESVVSAKHRWRLQGPIILYVGTLHEHKNVKRLVAALEILNARRASPVTLAIVTTATPDQVGRLMAFAASRGLSRHVVALGSLQDSEVRIAYELADALVLPSLAEGFGLTALEAMECGTPCIVSDIPVLREVAGNAAQYFDPLDIGSIARGIEAVLLDRRLSSELVAQGRLRSRRFAWEHTAGQTLAAYDRAMR